MAGYVIANYRVTDEAGYARYLESVGATTAAHDGELLVADFASEPLEGVPHSVTIVLKFASKAAASSWYYSSEYQTVVHLRQNHTEGFVLIADHFVAPEAA